MSLHTVMNWSVYQKIELSGTSTLLPIYSLYCSLLLYSIYTLYNIRMSLHTVMNWPDYQQIALSDIKAIGYLIGQSNEIFDLHFFHYLNLPGPLTNRLKYFDFGKILVKISQWYSKFKFKKLTRWGIIPQVEIDPSGYDTPGSRVLAKKIY